MKLEIFEKLESDKIVAKFKNRRLELKIISKLHILYNKKFVKFDNYRIFNY